MSIVLAHQGNTSGAHQAAGSSAVAIRHALAQGWGIAFDIRRAPDGRFYVSPEARPTADGCPADEVMRLLRAHPGAMAAIGVKELGYEADLLCFLDTQRVLGQAFLFGMELIEPYAGTTARLMRHLHPRVRLAARVSDRGESIERALAISPASIVWLEEFDAPWCTAADVRRLRAAGRLVVAVSPERHGNNAATTGRRWADLIEWGVDGVCTDHPAAFSRVSVSMARPTAVRVAA